MTDNLVIRRRQVFLPVWEQTKGNDGYVSFELDPLLEDVQLTPTPIAERRRSDISNWERNGRRATRTA